MRIAILADIHSNYPALQAVLADISRQTVDEIILAGDMVNVAPFPREVMDVVQQHQHEWRMIRGNHEEYMLDCHDPECDTYLRDTWASMFWTYDQLNEQDFALFKTLPENIVIDSLIIMHGIPGTLNISPVPATSIKILDKWYGQLAQKYIITAHTHIPFLLQWADKILVNPGSVGVSFDGITAASYVIATQRGQDWSFEHRRVPYDVDLVAQAAQARGYLETDIFAEVCIRQIVEARPMMRSLLAQISQLEQEKELSLFEAIHAAKMAKVKPSYDYIFPQRSVVGEALRLLPK